MIGFKSDIVLYERDKRAYSENRRAADRKSADLTKGAYKKYVPSYFLNKYWSFENRDKDKMIVPDRGQSGLRGL